MTNFQRGSASTRLRHRLLQSLGQRNTAKAASGFTLIELLIVVIIVGILSAIALPAFLGQAYRAKVSAAKSLASSVAKECQVAIVEGKTLTLTVSTGSDAEVRLETDPTTDCKQGGDFEAKAIISDTNATTESFWTTTVNSVGAVTKECGGDPAPTNGCTTDTW